MKKLLSVIVFLSGLMPVFLGLLCIAAYPKALEMIKLADSPDVFQAVTLFGLCLIPLGVLQFLSAWWIWNGNFAGVVLARFAGLLILMDGILMITILDRPDLGTPDIVKGLLITILAFLYKKK